MDEFALRFATKNYFAKGLMQFKKIFRVVVKITFLSLVLSMSMFQLQILPADAASLTNMKDTMTRLQISTSANHDIRFVTPTGVDAASATITITFASDFDTDFIVEDDVDLAYSNDATCTSFPNEITTAPLADLTNWGVEMMKGVLTLTHSTDAANQDIPAGRCVQVEVGTNATSAGTGVNQILNPETTGSKIISFGGTFGDTGSLAVSIVDSDQVSVSASIDPFITFALSSTTCALGTLTIANVKTCTYTSTVSTNASDGYTATILAESDGTNIYLNNNANAGVWINDVSDFEITAGNEEYGFAIQAFGFGLPPSFDSDDPGCNEDAGEPGQALTSSPVVYAASSMPVTNSTETLCHIAGISAITEAGVYQQIVTLIATGRF
jgi:hypothetical protein